MDKKITQAFVAALDLRLKNQSNRLDSVKEDVDSAIKLAKDTRSGIKADHDKIDRAVRNGVAVIKQKASEQSKETLDKLSNKIKSFEDSINKKVSTEVKFFEDSLSKRIDSNVEKVAAELKETYSLDELKDVLRSLSSSDELGSIVDALANIKLEVPDTSSSLTDISSAIEGLDVALDLSGIEKALEENSKAIYFLMKQTETITTELQDLSDIVKADKIVEYDEKGRIKKVSVAV